jgi:hypothetical protein
MTQNMKPQQLNCATTHQHYTNKFQKEAEETAAPMVTVSGMVVQ